MSIGQTHVFNKLEKNSKAMEGQRLARVIAKKNKEGEYESEHLKESKCISIPKIAGEFSEAHVKALIPHIVGLLENAQDAIIRERVVEGASSINDAEIDIDACIKFLDADSTGGRLTKEYMQQWFVDTYSESAAEFIVRMSKWNAEELTEAQLEVIVQKTAVLRDMFAGFASGKYSPDIPKCKGILKFGEFLSKENWDSRMEGIIARTEKIREEKEKELSMDALGF